MVIPRLFLILLAIGTLFITTSVASASAPRRMKAVVPTRGEQQVVVLLNRVRHQHGLRSLRFARGLYLAARAHSTDMLRVDTFQHGDFARRIARFFHIRRIVGENIGWGSGSFGAPGGIVAMWMRSPPHRALILEADFRVVGVGTRTGVFQGTAGAHLVTADFAG